MGILFSLLYSFLYGATLKWIFTNNVGRESPPVRPCWETAEKGCMLSNYWIFLPFSSRMSSGRFSQYSFSKKTVQSSRNRSHNSQQVLFFWLRLLHHTPPFGLSLNWLIDGSCPHMRAAIREVSMFLLSEKKTCPGSSPLGGLSHGHITPTSRSIPILSTVQ